MHWALTSIKRGNRAGLKAGLVLTFAMGLTFLLTQIAEYARIGFSPSDNAFATVFFSLTGLHGMHVFIGLMLLLFAAIRVLPRPFLAGAPPRRRAPGNLLALRRRNVDRGLRHGVHPLVRPPPEKGYQREVQHMAERATWNPLRSEHEAFQFLIGAIAYFAAIVVASVLGGVWAGVAVFVVLTAAAVAWFLNRNRHPPAVTEPVGSRATPADEHRVLVVANETVAGRQAARGGPAGDRGPARRGCSSSPRR